MARKRKKEDGRPIDMNGKKPKRTDVGSVKITRTDGLYFTIEGGTFSTPAGVKGSFAATVGGAALVIYVNGDKDVGRESESYEVATRDIIEAILRYREENKLA